MRRRRRRWQPLAGAAPPAAALRSRPVVPAGAAARHAGVPPASAGRAGCRGSWTVAGAAEHRGLPLLPWCRCHLSHSNTMDIVKITHRGCGGCRAHEELDG